MNKKRLKTVLIIFAVSVVVNWVLAPGFLDSGRAQGKDKYLADRHQARGMKCSSCHKETPPKSTVPSAQCMQCHGGKEKLAKMTNSVMPNPHDSHIELVCEKCHHGHKQPDNACAQCHEFELKVR
jgi:hypothetical protein